MFLFASCSSDNRRDGTEKAHRSDNKADLDESMSDSKEEKSARGEVAGSRHGDASTKELAKYVNSGDEDKVLAEAGRILSMNPNDDRVLNGLGVFYLKNKKTDMAKLFFQRTLKANSNNSAANNNLGVIAEKENEDRKAIGYFKKAIALESNNYSAHANLGTIYLKYEDYEKAVDELGKAYSYYRNNNLAVTNNYAIALTGAKNYDKALDLYGELSKSRSVSVALNEAILLAEFKHENKKSKELLNKVRVLSTDPVILKKANDLLKWLDGESKNSGKGN